MKRVYEVNVYENKYGEVIYSKKDAIGIKEIKDVITGKTILQIERPNCGTVSFNLAEYGYTVANNYEGLTKEQLAELIVDAGIKAGVLVEDARETLIKKFSDSDKKTLVDYAKKNRV